MLAESLECADDGTYGVTGLDIKDAFLQVPRRSWLEFLCTISNMSSDVTCQDSVCVPSHGSGTFEIMFQKPSSVTGALQQPCLALRMDFTLAS